jgi:hypothetical protein
MTTATRTKRPEIGTALLLTIGLCLLGIVLGCLGAYTWPAGLFNPWHALPALNEPVSQMAGVTVDAVTVQTAGGSLLLYELNAPELGWVPVETARNQTDENCEPFAKKAPAIDDVRERRLACQNLADAGSTTLFVLRGDGLIWYWTQFDSAYMALATLVVVPLCGGIMGLAAGLVLFFILRYRTG